MIDYHIHTTYSDGEGDIEKVCNIAEERRIDEIGITDHLILAHTKKNRFNGKKIPKMFGQIKEMKKNFKAKIKVGIEIDYFENSEKEIEKIIENNQFDFVLGSIHFVDGLLIDESELYKKFTQIEAYKKYFSRLEHAVESQLFDVMAHPDYIRRFAVPFYKNEIPFDRYRNQIEKIAELLSDNKMGIEVNASGLRHDMINDSYPSIDFLKLCKESRVNIITVGSDAHLLMHVGFGLEKCLEKLKNIEYNKVTLFDRRKSRQLSIKFL